MKMNTGSISVIMGIYNCADTLPQAIDSILAQTYSNWELILCDDCSTDDTYAVAKRYAEKYPQKIKLLKNSENSRLAYTLNHCLAAASGELIARMDGDDYCAPDRFEKQVRFLREHPEYDLVGTSMRRFSGGELHDVVYKPEQVDKYSMRSIVPFNHATILTYRAVYDRLNGYTVSERTKRAQDYDLWFRFFHAGFRGCNLREPLYFVREDMNAIRRRTFRVRWNAYKTTRIGFRLLGFPRRWLIKPFFMVFAKSLVPYRVIYLYRKLQERRHNV